MTFRTLVVDDEPLARKRLVKLLARHREIEVVGEAEHGQQACDRIGTLAPDLVFLDIQMPGLSGFEVLAQLTHRPRIVFVTAHDEFAVKAFEEQALDYLLKPVEPERLARAVARLVEVAAPAGGVDARLDRLLEAVERTRPILRRLPVRQGARITLVDVAQAVCFRAEDKYTTLYTPDAEHVLDRTIDELDRTLDPDVFLRVHRSTIVNVNFVRELTAVDGGRFVVTMADARTTRIQASRAGARTLRERLGL
ncbi:MAG: LytTR family DNA-binding domain-containing protein [Vicinamibacterales bacterium]